MNDTIWISTAPGNASNMRPLRSDIAESDPDRFESGRAKIKNGEPISPDELPTQIFGTSSADEKDYRLPDLFHAFGYWVVSASAAEVLLQFDLGQGSLHPVKVLRADRQTPVGGEWFCVNFGNRKSAFLAADSPQAMEGYIREGGVKGWFPPFVTKDDDIAVSSVALNGADVWVDPVVADAFFFSGPLGMALRKVKADKGFFLSKCRVL